jgi:hypothetical protein
MKPVKANDFLMFLQGEMVAFCSILQLEEAKVQEMIDSNEELDPARSRLANHLMQSQSVPVNGADALLLALERSEMRLQAIKQTAQSLAPILEL